MSRFISHSGERGASQSEFSAFMAWFTTHRARVIERLRAGGVSDTDIAKRLGISRPAFYKSVRRARKSEAEPCESR